MVWTISAFSDETGQSTSDCDGMRTIGKPVSHSFITLPSGSGCPGRNFPDCTACRCGGRAGHSADIASIHYALMGC